jgi:transposase
MPKDEYHDISEELWNKIKPFVPDKHGPKRGALSDERLFLNAVFWVLYNNANWFDLPERYGNYKYANRRFCRWRENGVWDILLPQLEDEPETRWIRASADYLHCNLRVSRRLGGKANRQDD